MCKTILNLFVLNFVAVSLAMEDSDKIFDITQTNSISDQPNPLLFKLFNFLKDVPNDTLVKFDNSIEEIIEGLKKEDRVNKNGCPEGRRPRRLQLEDFDSQEMKRSRGLDVGQDKEECVEDIEEENVNQSGDVENDKSASEENSTNFDVEEDKTMENIANEVDESNEVLSVTNDETTKLFVATTTEPFSNAIAEVTIEKIFEEDADSKKAINGSFDNQNFTQRLVENSSIETKDEIVEITTIQTTTESEQETSTLSSRKMTTDEITPVEVATNKIMTENKPETSTLSVIKVTTVESTTNEALTQNVQDTDELTQITENKTETSTTPSRTVTLETVTESEKENSTLQDINGEVKDDVIKIQPAANSPPENSSLEINDIINDVFKINITTNEIVKVDTESVQPVTESQQENPTSVEKVQIDITTVPSLVDNQQENITKSPDINETTESTKSTDGKNDIPEIILPVITEAVPSELTKTKTTESSLGETPTAPDVGTTSSPITGSSSQINTTFVEEKLATDETTVTKTMEEASESVTFSTEVTVKTTTERPMPVVKTTEKTTETADEIATKTTVSTDETTAPADEMPTKTTVSIDETTEPGDEIPTKTTVSIDETTAPTKTTVSVDETTAPTKTTVSIDETTAPTKTTVSIDETTESITTETTRKVPSSLSETSTESETFTDYDTSPDHRLEPVFPDTKPSPVSTSPPAPGRNATQWQHQLIGSLVVLVAVLAAVFIVVKVARKNRAVSGSYKPQKREMALEEFKVEMDLYRDNYPKGERLI